jgi:protein-S-isoprenylcysteine O-methyltransferase Ste14
MSRTDTALLLYLVWIASSFGLKTAVHVKRTGSTGFNGLSGRAGSAEWFAGLLFGLALIGGALGAAFHEALPRLDALQTEEHKVTGIVLFAIGAIATTAAQLAMGDAWRIGVDDNEETELVTSGPFALARNPIFTTIFVTAAGLFLIVPNALTLIALVALLVAVEIQVRVSEEPYLLRHHGDAYRAYARRVGRFVPGVGRLD